MEHFTQAQDSVCPGAHASYYAKAIAELRQGQKTSHWMWFIFPQCAGLGQSEMSRRYAITSLAEARAYVSHPILGPRLQEAAKIVIGIEGRTARQIFASPDDLKFHASMTLFEAAAPKIPVFAAALAKYFSGRRHADTLRLLDIGDDGG